VHDLADLVNADEAGPRALAAVAAARAEVGVPYRWGGESQRTGFDCSGLVQWAYAKTGIKLPRVTDQQFAAPNGTPVDRKHLLPGDLVFFRGSNGYIHHVGISLGGDRFVNAPHTGALVRINSLDESYYAQQFAGGRRFDGAAEASRSQAQVLPTISRPRR
jgi:cell wall-associated NlpC family hydrolase